MRSRIDLGPLNGKRKLESCGYLFRIDLSKEMGERIETKQNCMRSNLPRSYSQGSLINLLLTVETVELQRRLRIATMIEVRQST
jgi:hypothetical protein